MYTADRKMLELVEILKAENIISSDKEFCEVIDINPGNFTKIKKSENYPAQNYHFTPEHIENACIKFKINANWIFGLSAERHYKKRATKASTLKSKTNLQTEF